MQTTRHGVGVAVELATRVQLRQHDLHRGFAVHRVGFDRDATSVVDDADTTVGQQRDLDAAGITGHRLVDGVVHNLLDQVVQATYTG